MRIVIKGALSHLCRDVLSAVMYHTNEHTEGCFDVARTLAFGSRLRELRTNKLKSVGQTCSHVAERKGKSELFTAVTLKSLPGFLHACHSRVVISRRLRKVRGRACAPYPHCGR